MMGVLSDLYRLKVKVFLGALRASKAGLILLSIYLLSTIGGTASISMAVVDSLKRGTDLIAYLEPFSAMTSGLLSLILLLTLRGFVAFEYEQSLIFTSPITPRRFLIASLLADITSFSVFFCPAFISIGVIIFSLGLPIMPGLSTIIAMVLFAFFLLFLRSSLSVLQSTRQNSLVKIILIVMVVVLLLPATSVFSISPLRYNELPYPSVLLAQIVLEGLSGRLPPIGLFLGMTTYFLASLSLFFFCSKRDIFRFAKPVSFVSPFDTSMKMQTVKMGKNIRFFTRAGLGITLDLGSESTLRFLMKKELIRMIRDGSFASVLVLYLIVAVMGLASGMADVPFPAWIFVLATYSFMVPAMLVSNWRIGELDNLWIPLTSGADLGYVVNSLLYDLTLIAFVVPAGAMFMLSVVTLINPLLPLVLVASTSMIGSSTNLFTMMHFLGKKRRGTPSLMISWASVLLFGLLISPTYTYVTISLALRFTNIVNLFLAIPILVYSVLIFWFFSKKAAEKASSIEL